MTFSQWPSKKSERDCLKETFQNKEQVIDINIRDVFFQHLEQNELLTSRKSEMDELKEGLKSLVLLDAIAKNSDMCKVLFCSVKSQNITFAVVSDILMPISTTNYAEEQSKNWFFNYLQLKESSDFPVDSRCRSLVRILDRMVSGSIWWS